MPNSKTYRLYLVVLTLLTVLTLSATAWSADEYPELRNSIAPALQKQLETLIRKKGLQKAVRQERLAIALVDITDEKKPRVAAINGDVMEYAASLPKIAILLTAFVQIEQGKLELDEKLETDLTAMIRYSSNMAATRVLPSSRLVQKLSTLKEPTLMSPPTSGGPSGRSLPVKTTGVVGTNLWQPKLHIITPTASSTIEPSRRVPSQSPRRSAPSWLPLQPEAGSRSAQVRVDTPSAC